MLVKPGTNVSLKDYDPADSGPYASAEEADPDLQKQLEALVKLQNLFYACSERALLIILQGMDTSGKDGTIRKVFSPLNPLGAIAVAFKKPTPPELAHDFLWIRAFLLEPRNDGALVVAEVDAQRNQLRRAGNVVHFENGPDADVELVEQIYRDDGFDWR